MIGKEESRIVAHMSSLSSERNVCQYISAAYSNKLTGAFRWNREKVRAIFPAAVCPSTLGPSAWYISVMMGSTLCFPGHICKMELSKMAFPAWDTLDLALSNHGLAVGGASLEQSLHLCPTQLLARRRLGEVKTWAKGLGLAL